ncbi:MAG: polysaccharide deacetylase family protein, partial [Rhizobiaceae bacterium]
MTMTVSLKTHAAKAVLSAIDWTRLGRLFPSARGRGVIFTLHHVRPKASHTFAPNAHLEITPEFLSDALQVAKDAGLIPARLEDLPALLSDGDPSSRYFAVTLDDGYRNNAEHAAPVFRQHKVPYT